MKKLISFEELWEVCHFQYRTWCRKKEIRSYVDEKGDERSVYEKCGPEICAFWQRLEERRKKRGYGDL